MSADSLGSQIRCAAKRVYEGRDKAITAARAIVFDGGPQMRAYRCPHCAGWHLTRLNGQWGADQKLQAEMEGADKPDADLRPAAPTREKRAWMRRREQRLLRKWYGFT